MCKGTFLLDMEVPCVVHIVCDMDPVVVCDHPLVEGQDGLVRLDPPHLEVPELGDGAGEDGLPPNHHGHVLHQSNKLRLKVITHAT